MTVPPLPRGSAPIATGEEQAERRPSRRRPFPFGVHQVLEYVLAGVLVELSLHTARSGLLLGGAAAFALLALTARGPLGVMRLCGRRLHAAADIVVALALAAAPVLPSIRPSALGIVAIEVVALLWLRVVTLTRYASPPPPDSDAPGRRERRGAGRGAPAAARTDGRAAHDGVAKVKAAAQGPMAPSAGDTGRAADMARTLGLFAGRAARRMPQDSGELADQAREAGRRAARVHRALRTRSRP
ncbi:MAG TPA: hypothetical protein VKU86_02845 [Acidimicrobiales bacterium]|nr:hypothetical protein [Acidimicrobiales bacterium]